ncbi:hypothetical protein Tco_0855926 [Tanacetum coccineum]
MSHRIWIRWTPYAAGSPPSPDYIPDFEEPQTPPVPQDEDERELMFIQPHDPDYVPEAYGYVAESDQCGMRMMRQMMVLLTIPWTGERMEMMMTVIHTGMTPMMMAMLWVKWMKVEEEEEHLAPAGRSLLLLPIVELITVPDFRLPISLPQRQEVERLLSMPTPPPSPLISLSPPSAGGGALLGEDEEEDEEHDSDDDNDDNDDEDNDQENDSQRTESDDEGDDFVHPNLSTYIVSARVAELAELHEHDTQDLYALLEDAQDGRTRNLGTSDTTTAAGYSYSDTSPETLRVIRDMRREMGDMQADLLALREQQRRARQPTLDARVPDHQDASRDANSHI